jgi:hypothetical protein
VIVATCSKAGGLTWTTETAGTLSHDVIADATYFLEAANNDNAEEFGPVIISITRPRP